MLDNGRDDEISTEVLALLGMPDIGYVKTLENGQAGLFSADGTLLAECANLAIAAALAQQNGLTPFAVN